MRQTPLRPGRRPLMRRKRVKPVNGRRRAMQRALDFGPQAEWLRELPCCTCPHFPPSEPSHVRSRGAGGTRDDQIPQCPECHGELHADGVEVFQARRPGCYLHALASEYAVRWAVLPAAVRTHYEQLFRERWPDAARFYDEEKAV